MMCGIAGIAGKAASAAAVAQMLEVQRHRGPDAYGVFNSPTGTAVLGHCRLSIIDLSDSGRQPMCDSSGRYWIVFNGEIYNYLELRRELDARYAFRTQTDTEVLLAAYTVWGPDCLDRLIGMFAFAIWDEAERALFAVRDRFGVKPLYYHCLQDGSICFASEIKALHAAGVPAEPDELSWANYLARGMYDHSERTFWSGVSALPAGHTLRWHAGRVRVHCWYDVAERVGLELDRRPIECVEEEYRGLLEESVKLRFRSDVPVGINLSGGLDSSTLFGLVQRVRGVDSDAKAFTFSTGDPAYDELPWVEQMLAGSRHPFTVCQLNTHEVPDLARDVQAHQDEPFGGLPTLAYARLFEEARGQGVVVLLDGQGMDEQWAGYDYYAETGDGQAAHTVQGTQHGPVRPECLQREFASLSGPWDAPTPFGDRIRDLQYRDTRHTKIPRALRFNDRVSMRSSTELREPFLDHRLFELALKQPDNRKIAGGSHKWLLRRISRRLLPQQVAEAPKRPLQTPQREWLRGPLRPWAEEMIDVAVRGPLASWVFADRVRNIWTAFCRGEFDNSFFVWQWISAALLLNQSRCDCLSSLLATRHRVAARPQVSC